MSAILRMISVVACLTVVAVASDLWASIQLPESTSTEQSIANFMKSVDDSDTTSTQSSSSRDSSPSIPLPKDKIKRLTIIAYAALLGASSTSSMAGGSTSLIGSSSGDLADTSASAFFAGDSLVGWTTPSRWLDIPLPPSVSLLRPPQSV